MRVSLVGLGCDNGMAMDPEGRRKGASRRYIMEALEGSLRRLGPDWIDLYRVPQPDPLTPIEETLRALDDLVRQGKVRYIGCSVQAAGWRLSPEELAEVDRVTG